MLSKKLECVFPLYGKHLRVLLDLGYMVTLLFEEITLDGLLGEGRLDAGYTLGC
jgi:hypothetical protein